ncbi:hypothetical protein P2L57_31450 [Streptomyces ferralitis]|uniref:Uncharacterized protein n=1 Tax=Streptantibioticus ferralitis TaxID=236510 RepID=A0ABT5Z8C0_9ACTN|nr:hypothetical protein [Streptantibioticus ferralitis]
MSALSDINCWPHVPEPSAMPVAPRSTVGADAGPETGKTTKL